MRVIARSPPQLFSRGCAHAARIVLLDIRAAVRDVSRPARRTVINQDYSAGGLGRARGPAPRPAGPGPRCVKARSRRNSDCLRGGNATSRHASAAISHASQGELSRSCRATPRHGYCTVSTTARLCIISRPSSLPPPPPRRRLSSRYTASRITTTTITITSSSSSKRSIHPIVLRRRPGPVSVRQRASPPNIAY